MKKTCIVAIDLPICKKSAHSVQKKLKAFSKRDEFLGRTVSCRHGSRAQTSTVHIQIKLPSLHPFEKKNSAAFHVSLRNRGR